LSEYESRPGPRVKDREPRGNDFRSLIRSRAVQAMLLATAAVQVGVVATGGLDTKDGRERRSLVRTAIKEGVALKLPAVVVKSPTPTLLAGSDEPATAQSLAAVYRRKGFTISDKLAEQIYAAAVKNEIDPRIAFGLVRTESEFKDYATSHVGAIGLTQLMIPTARWFKKGVTEDQLRDSATNLEIGFRYLKELIDRYHGDVELALTAYNRGTGTVDRVLKRGGDPDNGYAGKVLNR